MMLWEILIVDRSKAKDSFSSRKLHHNQVPENTWGLLHMRTLQEKKLRVQSRMHQNHLYIRIRIMKMINSRPWISTSKDFPSLSYSSMLSATSQLCETIGSGSLENSLRRATLSRSINWIRVQRVNQKYLDK